jgi:hypothetical protein
MLFFAHELPLVLVYGWKEGIAFDISMHARQVESLCGGQKNFIDLAATDHHYFTDIASRAHCFIH